MNLENFESHIETKILEKGIGYHASGSVVSLEYDGSEWVAEVEGSSNYTVTVSLSESGEITSTYCDCPYNMGEYCKHQVAVFFALRDELESGECLTKMGERKYLENLLKNLDKAALVSILMEYAGKNRKIKEELLLRYEKQGDILKHARNVIQSSINMVKRRDFVEYSDVYHALDGAYTVLEMVDDQLDSGNTQTAISLSIVILEEMIDLINYCDDSSGTVGEIISAAIEKINEAVHEEQGSPSDNNKKIFDIVFNHAQEKRYSGWIDWRIDLLSTILPLCSDSINRSKMEQYLANEKGSSASEWGQRYGQRQLQKLQYEILRCFDDETAANSYMEQHLDNSDFRETVIQNAISEELYDKALGVCLDGESQDVSYAGLVRKWKELKFTVYEKTNDIEAQKTLALELMQGDFNYYLKLKALCKKNEWPDTLKTILEKLWDSSRSDVYVKVLLHEKLKLELLEYCKLYNGTITSYYKYLLPDYKNDVALIFTKLIKQEAGQANTRGHYRNVCDLIRKFKKACGEKAARTIRDELAIENSRRPAFLDELSRL